jgi:hypothetical protein
LLGFVNFAGASGGISNPDQSLHGDLTTRLQIQTKRRVARFALDRLF